MSPTKKASRRGQVRACGHIWTPWVDGVATRVHDRFLVTTWRFGDIHQSKVFVFYPASRDPMNGTEVSICLHHGKTREAAMKRGLRWVEKYIKAGGPEGPDTLFPKLFEQWRTLYRRRIDILDHLFFVIGNGYSWLDGGIICTSRDEEEKPQSKKSLPPGAPAYDTKKFWKLGDRELRQRILDAHYDAEEAQMPIGPLPDDGRPRNFYPVGQYSNILCVPDDVRPEWLAVAYEAALALRDRQVTDPPPHAPKGTAQQYKDNIEYGREAVTELETRFPQLVRA